jgi:predicted nucleotidyltransferase
MRNPLKAELKKLGVAVVYLFGSRSTGQDTPLSDVDIGVVFQALHLEEETRAVYQSLFEIFSDQYPSRKVDIVFLQAAPLALQYSVLKEGKVLFQEDPIFRADYENRVINQYLDFRPVLDYFDSVAAKRYAQS